MSLEVNKTSILTFQGDDAIVNFHIEQLAENDLIYMAIRDRKTNELVIPEIKSRIDENHNVKFLLTRQMLDEIPVNLKEKATKYYYGIKRIDEETGKEDTILLKEEENQKPVFGENYLFILYRKKVEGEI